MVVLGLLAIVGWLFWLAVVVDCVIDRFVWCFFGSGLYMVAIGGY